MSFWREGKRPFLPESPRLPIVHGVWPGLSPAMSLRLFTEVPATPSGLQSTSLLPIQLHTIAASCLYILHPLLFFALNTCLPPFCQPLPVLCEPAWTSSSWRPSLHLPFALGVLEYPMLSMTVTSLPATWTVRPLGQD